MNIELEIVDHQTKLKVDGRNIETNVTNLNMVIRTLEAHRDHPTAQGVRWIAQREGRDPEVAVHKYWEGRGARSGD